jgi:CO/xanthine dehydrogenase FAD-binding subunit
MTDFNYVTPKSLSETLALISEYQDKARVIAGGTDFLAKMKKGLRMPEALINIECVDELQYIKYAPGEGLRIGSATTLEDILKSDWVKNKFPVLIQAVSNMASPNIRRLATIGGNLCNAAPSADVAPSLIVMDRGKL